MTGTVKNQFLAFLCMLQTLMGCHFMNALEQEAFQIRGGDDSSSGAGMISSALKAGNLFIHALCYLVRLMEIQCQYLSLFKPYS